jgi:hypothetical protein
MERSDQVNELAAALAKAQGEMKPAAKGASNPAFGAPRPYADLADCWEAVRGPLAKNGLSVVQLVSNGDLDRICVTTTLLHSSGQFLQTVLCLRPVKVDPQGAGSAITYMRRYSLMASTGLAAADEDDDGNAASGNDGNGRAGRTTKKEPAPKTPGKPGAPTVDQLGRLFTVAASSGWTKPMLKQYMATAFNVSSSKELTVPQYETLVRVIETTNFVAAMKEQGQDVKADDYQEVVKAKESEQQKV